jgi:hypothetical protein
MPKSAFPAGVMVSIPFRSQLVEIPPVRQGREFISLRRAQTDDKITLCTVYAGLLESEQDQIANPVWIALAGASNFDDLSRYDFRYGIAQRVQLESFANRFKCGPHGLNGLGVKGGFL